MRSAFLDEHRIHYNEELRLGEDYDLYARALARRAGSKIIKTCGYAAVVRGNSLNGKHRAIDLKRLYEADRAILAEARLDSGAQAALRRHERHVCSDLNSGIFSTSRTSREHVVPNCHEWTSLRSSARKPHYPCDLKPTRTMPKMFSFRSLEVFYWTAHLRSFSRAADKLHTTQPTISQRIGGMEGTIGASLFDRSAKPIALTATGRILLGHAELLLRQVASMERDLELSNRFEGTVRLGSSETIVQTWLSTFLEQAARHFPKLDIDMTVDVTPSMLDALRDGEIDMALMLGPTIVEGFTCVKLKDYPLKFYAAADLVPDNAFSIGSMPTTPIITYPRNTYPYTYLREIIFKEIGRIPRIFTNSSISTIEKMALDGLGVALVAEGSLSAQGLEKLRVLQSDIELPPLSFYAYYQAGVRGEVFEQLAHIACNVASTAQ